MKNGNQNDVYDIYLLYHSYDLFINNLLTVVLSDFILIGQPRVVHKRSGGTALYRNGSL